MFRQVAKGMITDIAPGQAGQRLPPPVSLAGIGPAAPHRWRDAVAEPQSPAASPERCCSYGDMAGALMSLTSWRQAAATERRCCCPARRQPPAPATGPPGTGHRSLAPATGHRSSAPATSGGAAVGTGSSQLVPATSTGHQHRPPAPATGHRHRPPAAATGGGAAVGTGSSQLVPAPTLLALALLSVPAAANRYLL